jgi:hypothetical protein
MLGCRQVKPGEGGILSVNNMKLVMWDMIQVDEFAPTYIAKDTTRDLKMETSRLYQKVFAVHKIDSATFFKSFEYYKQHPLDYKILLDSLSDFAKRVRDNRFNMNRIDRRLQTK